VHQFKQRVMAHVPSSRESLGIFIALLPLVKKITQAQVH
jgi:hypothetical protein